MTRRFHDISVTGWLVRLLLLAAAVYLDRRFNSLLTTGLLAASSVDIVFELLGLGRVRTPAPRPGDLQVVLRRAGDQAIQVIKVIRDWSDADYAAGADMLCRLPIDIGPRMAQADAETLRRQLVSAGATADIEQR
jgi:ribosomal protein L7/L12